MINKLKHSIFSIIGPFKEPYQEYYTHSHAEAWKWNYPFTQYQKDVRVLCNVGEDSNKSYIIALSMILEDLESKQKSGKLTVDKFRPIRKTLKPIDKLFFDNLYITDKDLAIMTYELMLKNELTITEVINYVHSILIKEGKKVKMTQPNIFALPF